MKRFWLLVMLGSGIADVASASTFSFGPPVRLTLARNSVANVAIGDINGDGRDDLAATSVVAAGQELSVFLQGASGSLASPLRLQVPYAHRGPIALVDLNGDGAAEIVVGKDMPGMTVVRLSAAGLSSTDYETDQACNFIATGDIDADGNVDVVCHDWKETAWIYYGNGNGSFRSTLRVRTPAGTYNQDFKQLRLADVTGDGRLDLLITASSINSFFVFPNNGMGAFWPPSVYTHPWSATKVWASALEVIDLDGDGLNEVVTASPDNGANSALNVYRRGANGYLALSQRIPLHDSTTALVAGDVDGEGDPELVAGHFSFNEVTLLGGGTAGLATQVSFRLPGFGNDIPRLSRQGNSNSLALGDLNHDGCMDLAGATYSGVQILYGCRPSRISMPINDFDGDGVSDLLWQYATSEMAFWQWADHAAYWECMSQGVIPCPWYFRSANWFPQAIGDFDGDGNSDLFWRSSATGANQIWNRLLFKRSITAVTSQDWQVVGAGDFDGDHRSDLLWRNGVTGANTIWKSANSMTQQAIAGVGDLGWKVAGIGDFDGDLRADVLWRHATTGRNEIWRAGRSDLHVAAATVSDPQWRIVGVGDFDGDGKDDIVWRNSATGANTIWLAANSAAKRAMASVTDLAWSIGMVGDYNGDGRADLMWRNGSTGANIIWRSADSRQIQRVESADPVMQLIR